MDIPPSETPSPFQPHSAFKAQPASQPEPRQPNPPRADRAELLQGTLDLLVLRVVQRGPSHGYAIAKRLRDVSEGVILVEEGTLYPALHRLEKRGFITSEWRMTETNRRARFYQLTGDGTAKLESASASWSALSGAIDRVLGTARSGALA